MVRSLREERPTCPGPLFRNEQGTAEALAFLVGNYDHHTCTEGYLHLRRHTTAKGNLAVEGALTVKGRAVAMQQDVEALERTITDLRQEILLLRGQAGDGAARTVPGCVGA